MMPLLDNMHGNKRRSAASNLCICFIFCILSTMVLDEHCRFRALRARAAIPAIKKGKHCVLQPSQSSSLSKTYNGKLLKLFKLTQLNLVQKKHWKLSPFKKRSIFAPLYFPHLKTKYSCGSETLLSQRLLSYLITIEFARFRSGLPSWVYSLDLLPFSSISWPYSSSMQSS